MSILPTNWREDLQAIASSPEHPEHAQLSAFCSEVGAALPELLAWVQAWHGAEAEADEWKRLVQLPIGDLPAISKLAAVVLEARRSGSGQVIANTANAKRKRKRSDSDQIERVKEVMRLHRIEYALSFDAFLKFARDAGVDNLRVRYDRESDRYTVHAHRDFEEPLTPRSHGALRGWYSPPRPKTLRT